MGEVLEGAVASGMEAESSVMPVCHTASPEEAATQEQQSMVLIS
jgi:hypothetical protein